MICEYLNIPTDVWFGVKFILQLLLAIIIYVLRQKPRKKWWLYLLSLFGIVGICAYPIFLLSQFNDFSFPVFLFYLLCLILIWCLFNVSLKDSLFIWISGCATQYVVSQTYTLFDHFFGDIVGEIVELAVMIGFYTLCYLTFAKKLSEEKLDSINNFTVTIISAGTFLITDILTNIGRNFKWENPLSNIYGIVLALMILLLDFNMFTKTEAERERDTVEKILKKEEEQYRITKEALNYIDVKSHDLKYQVKYLRSLGSGDQFNQAIGSMEEKIAEYDNIVKTSNPTLNTVLTEKNLYCLQFGIKLFYVVDSDAISFMEPEDIYALFSNLLDNAIECLKNEDQGKRFIDLNICKKADMLSVTVINVCTQPRVFVDNLPETTKGDQVKHGYGTKSIRYIAEKYGGSAAFNQQDESFIASALIPLKQAE